MATKRLTVTLEEQANAKLERLAQIAGKTKGVLAKEAIEKYIELESWKIYTTPIEVK